MGTISASPTPPEDAEPTRALRAACVHEFAHLVVARAFGARGFVTVARVASPDSGAPTWCGRFQLFGELDDDEWRIVALAGAIAEHIDGHGTPDARLLAESFKRPGALSDSDARLASGYDASDVERCLRLVRESWQEIEAHAAERAASIAADRAVPITTVR